MNSVVPWWRRSAWSLNELVNVLGRDSLHIDGDLLIDRLAVEQFNHDLNRLAPQLCRLLSDRSQHCPGVDGLKGLFGTIKAHDRDLLPCSLAKCLHRTQCHLIVFGE